MLVFVVLLGFGVGGQSYSNFLASTTEGFHGISPGPSGVMCGACNWSLYRLRHKSITVVPVLATCAFFGGLLLTLTWRFNTVDVSFGGVEQVAV